MQERRHYIRLQVPVLVEFPNPLTMKTERSYTLDISETGIRFPTAVRLAVSQQVALTLQLPFQNGTFHVSGDVAWIREIARMGATQYEVGVRFRWMEEADLARLSRFLQNFLSSSL